MLPNSIGYCRIAANAESADFVQSPLAQTSNSLSSSSTLHEAKITVRRSPAALSVQGVHEAMEPDPKSAFPDCIYCMCLHLFPIINFIKDSNSWLESQVMVC